MYVYVHCTTYHPYRVQQPSVQNSRNISYIYLPNTATGCIKNTGCSFNYNHNHKYMYVCINLCSRGILILTLYYYRKESKYVSTEKMGLLCVVLLGNGMCIIHACVVVVHFITLNYCNFPHYV